MDEDNESAPAMSLETLSEPRPRPTKPSKKATISAMKSELAALGLDTTGKKETLYKRLLAAFTRAQEEEAKANAPRPRPPRQRHLSYLCFDVEGTCEAGTNFDYPNEIIEFPVVLLQWAEDDADDDEIASEATARSSSEGADAIASRIVGGRSRRLHIIDTFHTYVRPTWRPKLSEFCTSLTGIQQSTVDAAPTFPEVLLMFEEWLDSWGLRDGDKLVDALWVTDGPWDLRDFIPKQLHITPTTPPRYPEYLLGPYLNIKRAVASVLSNSTASPALGARGFKHTTGSSKQRMIKEATGANRYLNIPGQLQALGLGQFAGRQHSGVDDATNIARILIALTERDVLIEANAFLPPARNAKRWPWMGKPGEVLYDEQCQNGNGSVPAAEQDPTPRDEPAAAVKSSEPEEGSSSSAQNEESASLESSNPAEETPPPIVAKKKKKKKSKAKAADVASLHQAVRQELEALSLGTKAPA